MSNTGMLPAMPYPLLNTRTNILSIHHSLIWVSSDGYIYAYINFNYPLNHIILKPD